MRKLLIFITVMNFQLIEAQKIVKVENVTGKYELMQNAEITPAEAWNRALHDAKINALRKAGVGENIHQTESVHTQQSGKDMTQDYRAVLFVNINGGIKNWETVSKPDPTVQNGAFIYTWTINAEVIKYEKQPDPGFYFDVEGLKPSYNNNTPLTFTFTPSADGYLKIFNLNDNDCSMTYPYVDADPKSPINDNANYLFKEKIKVLFPMNKNMEGYYMTTDLKKEKNYLVFVYTKKNIPFIKQVTDENLEKWINTIDPDEKYVEYYNFDIVK
jgi:hypothetical protein